MIDGHISPEVVERYHMERVQNAFIKGQQSGCSIYKKIYDYKLKRKREMDDQLNEFLDDAIFAVFTEYKESFPCVSRKTSCNMKSIALMSLDKLRDTFLDRLEQKKRDIHHMNVLNGIDDPLSNQNENNE